MAGQQELVIGTPEANRGRLETESLVGFFVSTLALRIDLRDDPDLPTLIARIRHTVLAARENRDLPFEQVVELVNPPRHGLYPAVPVMLARQDGSVRDISLHGLQAESAELGYQIAKYDLTLDLAERDEQISGTLNFATALFDRATAERYGVYGAGVAGDGDKCYAACVASRSAAGCRARTVVVRLEPNRGSLSGAEQRPCPV